MRRPLRASASKTAIARGFALPSIRKGVCAGKLPQGRLHSKTFGLGEFPFVPSKRYG